VFAASVGSFATAGTLDLSRFRGFTKGMGNDVAKAAQEKTTFLEFARVARLGVIADTVENRPPPEPDIFCMIEGRGPVAFELVDLIDEGLARAVARSVRGPVEGVWYGKSPLEAIREKCAKKYETQHPIELVICTDDLEVELLEPPSAWFAAKARRLLQRSPFQRVWVVKLTDKQKSVWFTCSRA
jgi:hypothetical protein